MNTEYITAIIFIIAGGFLLLAGIIIAVNKRPLMIDSRYIKLHTLLSLTGITCFALTTISAAIDGTVVAATKYIIAGLLLVFFAVVSGVLLVSTKRSYYFIGVSSNFNEIIQDALKNLSMPYVKSEGRYNLNTLDNTLETSPAMFGLSCVVNLDNNEDTDILRQISSETARLYRTTRIQLGAFFWLNVCRLIFSGIFVMAMGILLQAINNKAV
jgi:hypothetical protein